MHRQADLAAFYDILDALEAKLGGRRLLSECDRHHRWPQRGVYFFFEPGEQRSESGHGSRVIRVGTHALKDGSKATLWNRLSQHRGIKRSGGGNHRGSIFRLLVGVALKNRDSLQGAPLWGTGSDPTKAGTPVNLKGAEVRNQEHELEVVVSAYIRSMPFLWIDVNDDAARVSDRALIERNSIGLLSNYQSNTPLDRPSPGWLGGYCDRERVRASGLWNYNHVDEGYDATFIEVLAKYVAAARG